MSHQSARGTALMDKLEENLIALKSLRFPMSAAAQAELILDEAIQSLAKVRKEHADEVASLRNTVRVQRDYARNSNDPVLANNAGNFALRFSDYRYEDGPPFGEARFSDYRYSPEDAGDRFSDYQVMDHEDDGGLKSRGGPSAAGLISPRIPELQALAANNAAFQEHHEAPVPDSGGDESSIAIFKSFKVGIEDPCYKVLPAALHKYDIQADWRQYALYLVCGDQERYIGLEEKPLALLKALDREGKKPTFMLRKLATPSGVEPIGAGAGGSTDIGIARTTSP